MTTDTAPRRMAGFDGEVVYPGDPDYDRRRAVWNAMHDRRPALIARCTSERDVAAAIEHGRREEMPIAARGGGHSMPGHSTCDGGIVIDLRAMNGVEVDPVARRATVQGGALLGELDRATQRHGLVVPAGVVSHTGVGGLTLGGGVGRLMRRFGLTIDSLLAARVVTATGQVLEASETQNPDLFWGIRGGGGNFGVVTEFEFGLHELSELLILATFHPLERAPEVLAHGRRAMAGDPPDELLWTSFLRKAPPLPWVPPELVGRPGIVSLVEWSGMVATGRERLEALERQLTPLAGTFEAVPFLRIQTLTDEIFAAGKRTYIKAGFATELTDELIAAACECGRRVGSEFSQIEVLALGGAIRRVAPGATAFPHRDAGWLINIPATWEARAADAEEIDWVRSSFAAIEPHLTGGKYVNFMGEDEREDTGGAYRGTLCRLREVKRAYDPANVFRLNQNIAQNCRRLYKLYAIILPGMIDVACKIDWSEQEFKEVRPNIYGATVHTPQLTATLYRYGGGSSWEEHQHPQDQITTVLEGVIDFVVDGRPVRLEVGQLAALPGGTPHSATVPDGGAVTLNVFTYREAPPNA